MRTLHGLIVVLGLSAAACGRISVELLPSDLESDDVGGSLDVPHILGDAAAQGDGDAWIDVDSSALVGDPIGRDSGAIVVAEAGLSPNAPTTIANDASAPAAGDAAVDASADAALRDAGDASRSEAGVQSDAASGPDAQTPPVDASSSSCAGESVFGLCWYLERDGRSCNDTCSAHGGYDPRAESYVGTDSQGGSIEECAQILSALGRSSRVNEGTRSDDLGLGCHVWTDGTPWWLREPRFHPDVAAPGSTIGIVCACAR